MRASNTSFAIFALLALAAVADARPRSRKPANKPVIAQADAEPARTKQAVVVRKKPSAKAAAAGKIPANTVVVVEGEDGTWLRIRAKLPGKKKQEIVGFVAKSMISIPVAATPEPPPPTTTATADDTPAADTPVPKESRKTADKVVIRDQPGEKQKALATLPAGATVIVEAERGRWLRVRAGKVVGYLARTTLVDLPAPPAPPDPPEQPMLPPTVEAKTGPEPPTTGEAPQSKWGGARRSSARASTQLFAEVTAPAALRADPRADASVVAEVAQGARLTVVETGATGASGWVKARDAGGHEGWITLDKVGNGTAAVAISGSLEDRTVDGGARSGAGGQSFAAARKSLSVRVDAGIGYRIIGMSFTSNGTGALANYVISADAAAADAGVDVGLLRVGRLSVAADGTLAVGRSSPGIEYMGPTLSPGRIPFSTFAVDAGARAAVRLRRMFELAVRGGVHYDAFLSVDVENVGKLPRESLYAGTLGVRADIVPPRSRFSATLRADRLMIGWRRQTPGLEDGADSTASAMWGGMTVRVHLARHFSVLSAYDFARTTTEWSGQSVRMSDVTNARRVDSSQLVQIGLSVDM